LAFDADQVVSDGFKGIVMADDNELLQRFEIPDRFGQLLTTLLVHIGGGFIKEGNIDVG
jgi:hypothetical protein